ncbi:mercuric resistance transcriptional repressor protein MerD (plasmid) [Klebsiella pneumoniae]|nr:transcriptional regulator MerD [Klebsiella pneumoniae]QWC35881.1 mercuric resistance transcriptional repressor protein MerD [Klebsiella pneumoniae subsp. pneumoniae]APP38575.1 mercuric resistance transcriptional repressor protein MerD [Klebsiella pneumoniae]APP50263.1 mercuric resistance transcriptional repressor protein MerD [Klebsiella pneumoniae]APP56116.1 mercuric resistance transcriptional repressor protein MerD [Klebsiella pneumoniae]
MNAYTVSRLALDAGVSVHIVRDYLLRGLLRPVACTTGGYGLFDDAALQRLCFVRAAFEAGIGLGALGHCCKVSDEAAFCLIQRPYISKTLLTRRISPRGSP